LRSRPSSGGRGEETTVLRRAWEPLSPSDRCNSRKKTLTGKGNREKFFWFPHVSRKSKGSYGSTRAINRLNIGLQSIKKVLEEGSNVRESGKLKYSSTRVPMGRNSKKTWFEGGVGQNLASLTHGRNGCRGKKWSLRPTLRMKKETGVSGGRKGVKKLDLLTSAGNRGEVSLRFRPYRLTRGKISAAIQEL